MIKGLTALSLMGALALAIPACGGNSSSKADAFVKGDFALGDTVSTPDTSINPDTIKPDTIKPDMSPPDMTCTTCATCITPGSGAMCDANKTFFCSAAGKMAFGALAACTCVNAAGMPGNCLAACMSSACAGMAPSAACEGCLVKPDTMGGCGTEIMTCGMN